MNLSANQFRVLSWMLDNSDLRSGKNFMFEAADSRIASRLFSLGLIEGLMGGGYIVTPLGIRTAHEHGWQASGDRSVRDASKPLLKLGAKVRTIDMGARSWGRTPDKREDVGVIRDHFRPYGRQSKDRTPPYYVVFEDGETGWYRADEVEPFRSRAKSHA